MKKIKKGTKVFWRWDMDAGVAKVERMNPYTGRVDIRYPRTKYFVEVDVNDLMFLV
ncbi:MAG: hypothetical protein LBP98_09220 [Tannerella sp.]|nr:hypothetical protein [Tannerella sp.]